MDTSATPQVESSDWGKNIGHQESNGASVAYFSHILGGEHKVNVGHLENSGIGAASLRPLSQVELILRFK